MKEKFPDHTIVVRPHPSENHNIWEQTVKDLSGCLVTGERNVLEWILASDVLIHTNCTTAVEAFLMGRRAIFYKPYPLGDYAQTLPNGVSLEAKDLDELIDMVGDVLNGSTVENSDAEKRKFAQYYIEGCTGKLASEKVLDFLEEQNFLVDRKRNSNQMLWVGIRSLWLVAQKMKEISGKHSSYDTKKFPGISMEELEHDVEKFGNVTNERFNIKIKPVGKDCFFLTQ